MKITLKLVVILFLAITSVNAENFAGPEYNHKLWRVSGNGLKKDSYIFVIYNTSNKKVFMVEDSVINAFKNADLIIHNMNLIDKNRNLIPEKRQYDLFDFEKHFSTEKLREIEDTVEARGGYFKRVINSHSSFQLLRSLKTSNKFLESINNYKLDIGSILQNFALFENKEFDGIYDINFWIEYFHSLKDEEKVDDILKYLECDEDKIKENLFSSLYFENRLDSILMLTINKYKPHDYIEFNNIKDSTYKFIIKYLRSKSVFVEVPVQNAIGNDGVIDKLRKSGFSVEPIKCDTYTDLYKLVNSYDEMDWTNVFIQEFGIDISLPKLYLNSNGEGAYFGKNYFDASSLMGYFVEVYDVPDFSSINPLKYFYEANLKMRADYTENTNLKQIYTPDSLIKFECEAKRNRFYQKYHLVYRDKKIFKLTAISDTLNMNIKYADKFLSNYKFGKIPDSKKYLYTSPSKDFQVEFLNKPEETYISNDSVNSARKLMLVDIADKQLSRYSINLNELAQFKFYNDDSIAYDIFYDNYKNSNKFKDYVIILNNLSSNDGFTTLDFCINYDKINMYHRLIVSHDRVYNLQVNSPQLFKDSLFKEFVNSFKIIFNHNIPMKTIESETAKFKLPENMVQDSLIEDNSHKKDISWGYSKYFKKQKYLDTIHGFYFDYKICQFPNNYFVTPQQFITHSLKYLTSKFGPYELVYCKPYSDKIKNSYIFEIKSTKSKAVMKGIFYPYKNATHSLEVRTHQAFLDSSYINDVFDSFEISFEPEEEEELFESKLLEGTKYVVDNKYYELKIGRSSLDTDPFTKSLNLTKHKSEVEQSIEYILNDSSDINGMLKELFNKYSEIVPKNELIQFHKSIYDKASKNYVIYKFMILSEIAKSDEKQNVDFILNEMINLSNSFKIYKDFRSQNNFHGSYINIEYYVKLIFRRLRNQLSDVIENKEDFSKILSDENYRKSIFEVFDSKNLYKLRNSENLLPFENGMVEILKDIVRKDSVIYQLNYDEKERRTSIVNSMIYLCKQEKSLLYIRDSVLNYRLVSNDMKNRFYSLNYKFLNENELLELINNKSYLYNIYSEMRYSGDLDLLPKKFKNYESIAESQIYEYFTKIHLNIIDWRLKKVYSHKSSVNGSEVKYKIFHLSKTIEYQGYHGIESDDSEVSFIIGPYNVETSVEKLEIPDFKVSMMNGKCRKSDFERLIKSHQGVKFDDIKIIYLDDIKDK